MSRCYFLWLTKDCVKNGNADQQELNDRKDLTVATRWAISELDQGRLSFKGELGEKHIIGLYESSWT